MAKGEKTNNTDGLYQRMVSIKKTGGKGDKQKSGEDTYRLEGWSDDPEMESSTAQKDKFQKQKVYDQMMENRKKKLNLGKWERKK